MTLVYTTIATALFVGIQVIYIYVTWQADRLLRDLREGKVCRAPWAGTVAGDQKHQLDSMCARSRVCVCVCVLCVRVCVCVCVCLCVCVQLCSEEPDSMMQGHAAFTAYRVQRSYGCGWEGGLGQSPVPACAVACLESFAVIPLE